MNDEDLRNTLCANIEARMAEMKINRSELSRRAFGNGKHYIINNLFNGRTNSPQVGTVHRIADALETTVSFLIGEESSSVVQPKVDQQTIEQAARLVIDYFTDEDLPLESDIISEAIGNLASQYVNSKNNRARPKLVIGNQTVVFPAPALEH